MWDDVAVEYNAVAITRRIRGQLKKKWQDLGQLVKLKNAKIRNHRNRTGGGPPPSKLQLSQLKQRIFDLIKAHWRRSTSNVDAGPNRLAAHQEEAEGDPEVPAEVAPEGHPEESPKLFPDFEQDDLDEGQYEDPPPPPTDQMVILDLLLVEPMDQDAGPSVVQQCKPVRGMPNRVEEQGTGERQRRKVGRIAEPQTQVDMAAHWEEWGEYAVNQVAPGHHG
uniref:uncharacterized protein isoform X2 n=1 Tax=Pristiophorus japonicus TaxID=55135 RepID=UPI00398EBACC